MRRKISEVMIERDDEIANIRAKYVPQIVSPGATVLMAQILHSLDLSEVSISVDEATAALRCIADVIERAAVLDGLDEVGGFAGAGGDA